MLTFVDDLSFEMYFPQVPVVFLHAFPLNRKMWRKQFEYLRENNIGYIAVDYPGFGQSKAIGPIQQVEEYGNYIFKLLKEMGVEKAVFVGLSMGGYVAFSLYKKHPDIFAGFMLANTRAAADNPQTRQNRLTMIESLSAHPDLTPVIEDHLPKFFTDDTRQRNPSLIDEAERLMRENSVEGVIQAQQSMASRPDFLGLLKEIKIPVSVVTGEKDSLTGPDLAREMSEKIPDAVLEVITNAAHLSNMEQPSQFNEKLLNLIRRCIK